MNPQIPVSPARRRQGRLPVAVILAAGGSRRLGRPKQFLRWRGSTLLAGCIRRARGATGQRPWVITGARRFAVGCAASRAGARILHNPEWTRGMGSSLARAATHLRARPDMLVLTVDQFRLRGSDLRRLIRAWRRRPRRAAAAAYAGRVGIPAVLPQGWGARVRRLSADYGAREWLNARGGAVTRVPMPRAGNDVDTLEDWRR